MPLLNPSKEELKNKEGRNKFVSRCISDVADKDGDKYKNEQRIAMCERQYDDAKKKESVIKETKINEYLQDFMGSEITAEEFLSGIINEADKWIPKDIEKGGLHKDLGIPEDEDIPTSLLDKIIAAKTGDTLSTGGKGKGSVKVTTQLQQRANFAKNVRK